MGENPSPLGEDFSIVNSKSEYQNPNGRNSKTAPKASAGPGVFLFWEFVFWTFDIVSDFGFRASDFKAKIIFLLLNGVVGLGYIDFR